MYLYESVGGFWGTPWSADKRDGQLWLFRLVLPSRGGIGFGIASRKTRGDSLAGHSFPVDRARESERERERERARERERECVCVCKIPLYNLDSYEQTGDQSLSPIHTTLKLPLCIMQSSSLEPMPFGIVAFISAS